MFLAMAMRALGCIALVFSLLSVSVCSVECAPGVDVPDRDADSDSSAPPCHGSPPRPTPVRPCASCQQSTAAIKRVESAAMPIAGFVDTAALLLFPAGDTLPCWAVVSSIEVALHSPSASVTVLRV